MKITAPQRRARRRALALAGLAVPTGMLGLWPQIGTAQQEAGGAAPKKVLRYAFRIAETGFDPTQISDLYSRTVTPHIFEGLYTYDHLARPIKFKPLTTTAMPEVSDDFRTWTMKIQPGILFADDPAFKGKRRELVAEDYVYAFKRFADPALKSPVWGFVDTFKLAGLAEQRKLSMDSKKPFDYETPIAGARALDRYTLQIKLEAPRPRFIEFLAAGDLFGAVAREVVEAYGDAVGAHPVGTGPFRLTQWRRASLMVLERNPNYRERYYDAEPNADDAEGLAIAARLKGKRLPMVDRVEVSIVEENQPRWLSFLNGQHDMIEEVPPDFITQAIPNNVVAPNLAKQGVQMYRRVRPDLAMTFFNMENPIVGGYTPDKVALRRAISLGIDIEREIHVARRNQAMPAQAPAAPHTSAYDPSFKSEMSEYDPARANALLDLYGYLDKTGDGWRDMPDGSPLVLEFATLSDQASRQQAELWQRNMNAIKLRITFKIGKWPEHLKAARAGTLMMWGVGGLAASPDGQGALQRYHGKQVGGQNIARFRNAEFDTVYEKLEIMPDGPERQALFLEAKRIAVAYMPYRMHVHRYQTDLTHAQLVGYRKTLFWNDWWQYVDIEPGLRTVGA